MTNQQLDIPFSKIDEWEALLKKGVCAAFEAAAQWGYEQRNVVDAATASQTE
jgi:hypothetical protein